MKKPVSKRTDPKLHVRKTVAGVAAGALMGAAVAGPIGAIVGGTVGTLVGNAAEDGRRLSMPKQLRQRAKTMAGRTQPRSKAAAKSSRRPAGTKKSSSASRGKRSVVSMKHRSSATRSKKKK